MWYHNKPFWMDEINDHFIDKNWECCLPSVPIYWIFMVTLYHHHSISYQIKNDDWVLYTTLKSINLLKFHSLLSSSFTTFSASSYPNVSKVTYKIVTIFFGRQSERDIRNKNDNLSNPFVTVFNIFWIAF